MSSLIKGAAQVAWQAHQAYLDNPTYREHKQIVSKFQLDAAVYALVVVGAAVLGIDRVTAIHSSFGVALNQFDDDQSR